MKIRDVDYEILAWPELDPPFWMSLLPVNRPHELIVKISTDEGIVGIGHTDQIPGVYRVDTHGRLQAGNASRILPDLLAPILMGRDPTDIEALWNDMFGVTYKKHWNRYGWSRGQIMAVIAACDMALWDIRSEEAGQPVFRLPWWLQDVCALLHGRRLLPRGQVHRPLEKRNDCFQETGLYRRENESRGRIAGR
ncbi:MAG: hypothetical protein O3B95_06875 [Chloroflexi bacterium]|nr:hypothetical protein [Chloroflexota bacterium]